MMTPLTIFWRFRRDRQRSRGCDPRHRCSLPSRANMTVSTVVARLLPIMWSTRTGAEVMKPLATPVLGGMVSSLLHVLIVTPVIFT